MPKSPQLDRKEVFLALTDPNTFATVLHIILLSSYGEAIYDTDPMDLYLRLEEDFGAQPIEECENRVQAILMATSTDLFYHDPHAFTAIAEALTNGDPGIEVMEQLTLPEVLWALYEVELNRDAEHPSKGVSDLINQVTEAEAQDAEEDGVDVHPLEYLKSYLEGQREALAAQLKAIGAEHPALPPIHSQ